MYPKWSKVTLRLWETYVDMSDKVNFAWSLIVDVSFEPVKVKKSGYSQPELEIRGKSGLQTTALLQKGTGSWC